MLELKSESFVNGTVSINSAMKMPTCLDENSVPKQYNYVFGATPHCTKGLIYYFKVTNL